MEILVRRLLVFLFLYAGCGIAFDAKAMQHTLWNSRLSEAQKEASMYYMKRLGEEFASLDDDFVCCLNFFENCNCSHGGASLQKELDDYSLMYESIKTRTTYVCESLKIVIEDDAKLIAESQVLLSQIVSLQKKIQSYMGILERYENFDDNDDEVFVEKECNCNVKVRIAKRERHRFKLPKNHNKY